MYPSIRPNLGTALSVLNINIGCLWRFFFFCNSWEVWPTKTVLTLMLFSQWITIKFQSYLEVNSGESALKYSSVSQSTPGSLIETHLDFFTLIIVHWDDWDFFKTLNGLKRTFFGIPLLEVGLRIRFVTDLKADKNMLSSSIQFFKNNMKLWSSRSIIKKHYNWHWFWKGVVMIRVVRCVVFICWFPCI